jgi:hypothetical protein
MWHKQLELKRGQDLRMIFGSNLQHRYYLIFLYNVPHEDIPHFGSMNGGQNFVSFCVLALRNDATVAGYYACILLVFGFGLSVSHTTSSAVACIFFTVLDLLIHGCYNPIVLRPFLIQLMGIIFLFLSFCFVCHFGSSLKR